MMSTLWSKLLETFVADFTMNETRDYWKGTQHGGIKGSSTEHVLIETWDRVLRSLDTSKTNKTVVLTALDFSKSFSKCTYEAILTAYARLNASQWLINIHKAFLEDRTMVVKLEQPRQTLVELQEGLFRDRFWGFLTITRYSKAWTIISYRYTLQNT